MNFLKITRDDVLILKADNSQESKWYLDGAIAVHPYMKSHTGAVFAFDKGPLYLTPTNKNPTREAQLRPS